MLLLFNFGLSFAKLEAKFCLNLSLTLTLTLTLVNLWFTVGFNFVCFLCNRLDKWFIQNNTVPVVLRNRLRCLWVRPHGQMVYSKQYCTCGAP